MVDFSLNTYPVLPLVGPFGTYVTFVNTIESSPFLNSINTMEVSKIKGSIM
jgi:hypothetical protein